MNAKKIIAAAFFAVLAGGVYASESESASLEWAPGEGVSYGDKSIMSTEATLKFHSKYMYYGVVYGNDPIVVPGACATFFDWAYVGIESIFDTTKGNGKGFGYGNRAGRYTTIDASVGIAHEFELNEFWGTLGVDFGYMYEYFTRHTEGGIWDCQYLTLEMELDWALFLKPTLYVERELMYDDGTYASLKLGHTFNFDDVKGLSLTPSITQGFGNSLRTKGYFAELEKVEGFDHGGLMDTTIMLELEYKINEWLKFGAYVAYYDYLFDDDMREAAAAYNAQWGSGEDKTWNFVGGLSFTATF